MVWDIIWLWLLLLLLLLLLSLLLLLLLWVLLWLLFLLSLIYIYIYICKIYIFTYIHISCICIYIYLYWDHIQRLPAHVPGQVLRPVIEAKGGWVPLVDVKTDANVTVSLAMASEWWCPERGGGTKKMDGLFHGKSHLEMDDQEWGTQKWIGNLQMEEIGMIFIPLFHHLGWLNPYRQWD